MYFRGNESISQSMRRWDVQCEHLMKTSKPLMGFHTPLMSLWINIVTWEKRMLPWKILYVWGWWGLETWGWTFCLNKIMTSVNYWAYSIILISRNSKNYWIPCKLLMPSRADTGARTTLIIYRHLELKYNIGCSYGRVPQPIAWIINN